MNTPQPPDHVATLTLANDPDLLPGVVDFIGSLAARRNLGYRAVRELQVAVAEGLTNVVRHAFRPGEQAVYTVTCLNQPGGFMVKIRDRGLPYDPSVAECMETQRGFQLMNMHLDKMTFVNLGHEGKELQMLKFASAERVDEDSHSIAFHPENFKTEQLQVRNMTTDDALQVSRCFYDVFGYDYGSDLVYYPQRLIDFNRAGLLKTVVAATPEGYVLGTESLERPDLNTQLFEAGMACVRPAARNYGVARAIGHHLENFMRDEGVAGIWAACVTSHTFSQRIVPPGCQACLLLPGNTNPDLTQGQAQKQRNSILVMYRDLARHTLKPTLYLPARHKTVMAEILTGFGWQPELLEEGEVRLHDSTQCSYDANPQKERVIAKFTRFGSDFPALIRERYNFFRTHGYAAVYAFLPLTDPYVIEATRLLEDMGFFFNGIFPGTGQGDAQLVLGFLNNQILDYDNIQILDEYGKKLKAYIQALDPELQKL